MVEENQARSNFAYGAAVSTAARRSSRWSIDQERVPRPISVTSTSTSQTAGGVLVLLVTWSYQDGLLFCEMRKSDLSGAMATYAGPLPPPSPPCSNRDT